MQMFPQKNTLITEQKAVELSINLRRNHPIGLDFLAAYRFHSYGL